MKVVVTAKTGDKGGPRGYKGAKGALFITLSLFVLFPHFSTIRFTLFALGYNSQHSVGIFECIGKEIKTHQEQGLVYMIGQIGTRLCKCFHLS